MRGKGLRLSSFLSEKLQLLTEKPLSYNPDLRQGQGCSSSGRREEAFAAFQKDCEPT